MTKQARVMFKNNHILRKRLNVGENFPRICTLETCQRYLRKVSTQSKIKKSKTKLKSNKEMNIVAVRSLI